LGKTHEPSVIIIGKPLTCLSASGKERAESVSAESLV
jgi:hypothetical protein